MPEHIILIGFMGCGKTTAGIKLSYRLRRPLVDMDRMIEQREGMSINEIFALKGEEAFRVLETQCLEELAGRKEDCVISTGGGLPLREENRRLLRQLGRTVYLRARPDTIIQRLRDDSTRPLLAGDDPNGRIIRLMEERALRYEEAADNIVDVDGRDADEIADEIAALMRGKGKSGRGKRHMAKILVINGPNINFLGIREKNVYGTQDYDDLLRLIADKGEKEGCRIEVFQSNHEGALIDRIQDAYFDGTEGIVINPGAYTHYSYAIRDALASVAIPKVEIHISDITKREEFRKLSVTAPACDKQIYGQGLDGYLQAIDVVLKTIQTEGEEK